MASIHLPALASKHIGSGPGVVGASGMQVQPLVPLRTTVMVPLASAVTIDASCASDAGAADSALATGSLGAVDADALVFAAAAVLLVPALLQLASARAAAPAVSRMPGLEYIISPSFHLEGRAAYHNM